MSATQQNNSLVIESLQTQAERNSQNRLRVSNMLKKHHHHHYHRHRHHHLSSIWLLLYNFPSKNKQNGLEIFMIHLCTIATLMFLQNNTSQKILFIAARTIQFPGVVFKVCIYLIVAIVTSSIYFDVKSTHTYRKYIYQQSCSKQTQNLSSRRHIDGQML